MITQGNINVNNLESNNLIKSQNLIVYGNFSVNGNTTILNTTNSVLKDNLIELNHNLNTSPLNDTGFIFNRGNQINAFLGWKENQQKFILGTTNNTSSDIGSLNINKGYLLSNIIGKIEGDSGSNIGSLNFSNGLITDNSNKINFTNQELNNCKLVSSNNINVSNQLISTNTTTLNNILIEKNSIQSSENLINFQFNQFSNIRNNPSSIQLKNWNINTK